LICCGMRAAISLPTVGTIREPCSTISATRTFSTPFVIRSFHPTGSATSGGISAAGTELAFYARHEALNLKRIGQNRRKALNAETIAELHKAFRRGGAKAIDKVMKNNPAMFLKLLVLLVPREMQVEQSGGIKAMTTEQIERSIELIKEILAKRDAAANAKVIEGEAEVVPSLPAPGSGGSKMPKV